MTKVLIPTQIGDSHAVAVSVALQKLGASVTRVHASDFPTRQTECLIINNLEGFSWEVVSPETSFNDRNFDVVWNRRLHHPVLPIGVLHPDDERVNSREMLTYARGLWVAVAPHSRWINKRISQLRASSKILQLQLAAKFGFRIPDTLITNDPARIRNFIDDHGGEVIHKTFGALGIEEGDNLRMFETARFTEHDLPRDHIQRLTTGIMQSLVKKDYEVRLTAFGGMFFALRIDSQSHGLGLIDWRNHPLSSLPTAPLETPEHIKVFCRRMMDALDIAFGAFDFIVEVDGGWTFIENNESGQFLFAEEVQPSMKILDSFSNWLIDSSWREGASARTRLAFQDVLASRDFAEIQELDQEHVKPELT